MLEKLKNQLDPTKPLFCDTETNHFYSSIRLVQVYQEHWAQALVLDTSTYPLQEIYNLIKDCKVIFHNYSYDGVCFCNDLKIPYNPFKDFEDTLILSRLVLYEDLDSFTLDSCLAYVMGYDPYIKAGLDKKSLQKSFLSTPSRDKRLAPLTDDQILYASIDVEALPFLYNKVKEGKDSYIYNLDKAFINEALRWQQYGLPVDKELLEETRKKIYLELEELNLLLPPSVNVNSYIQVRAFTGLKDSNDVALASAEQGGNLKASWVRSKRRLLKQLNFLERYDFDRVRGYYAPTAVSGRVRCSGSDLKDGTDNLMQIPRSCVHIFGFPKNDERFIVHSDFGQLEIRSVCVDSGDPVLERLFKEGEDLHTYVAQMIYHKDKKDITKNERLMGKFCNFSLLYGAGPNTFRNVLITLADTPPPPLSEIEVIVKKWKSIYPEIQKWHKDRFEKANRGLMLGKTLNGRPYKAKLPTDLLGVQNQGLGAEVAKLSLHWFCKRNPEARVINFVHDAFYIEAKDLEEGKYLAKEIGESMVYGWFESIKNAKIKDLPMPVDVEVGKNLKELEVNPHYSFHIPGTYEDYKEINRRFRDGF